MRAFCLLVELITRRRGYFSLQIGLACRCCLGFVNRWHCCVVSLPRSVSSPPGRTKRKLPVVYNRLPKARLNLTAAVLYSATPDERPLTLALDYPCFKTSFCVSYVSGFPQPTPHPPPSPPFFSPPIFVFVFCFFVLFCFEGTGGRIPL